MKKNILPLLLIVAPYLYVFQLVNIKKSDADMDLWIYYGMCALVLVPNIIYPFLLKTWGVRSRNLFFWDVVIKVCHIPIYGIIFLVGTIFFLSIYGILFIFFLIVFDYLLLLPSTMYGINGLRQARREGWISWLTFIIHAICHFVFCLDVISATIMYFKVRRQEAKGIQPII